MTVLRAGAPVVGYELREDFAARAQANVAATLGPDAPYTVEIRDVTEGIDEAVPRQGPAGHARTQGGRPQPRRRSARAGSSSAYLPTINQTALLRQTLESTAPLGMAETLEIMRRTWHVEARSVRPDHRMVGHTGFLTTARRLDA